ncbi:MAG: LacI family transcriptional regulator [Bifidobacteriaceae bacterium]|jgi:DNA-binding LacI/PurR family transcriptional regulator|nr:LacI family transcriptional regulator [Bifidobacteriaceae bacterium]
MTTLRDVARLASVSVTTASAALRNDPVVKSATKQKVIDAAESLNYVTNQSARYLKKGKSGIIALVIPDVGNPYFSLLSREISQSAQRHGLQTIIQQTNFSEDIERNFLKRVNSPLCDGLILNIYNVGEVELRQIIGNHPAVLFEDYSKKPLYDNVALPLRASMRAAFLYLKEQGYRHVAIVGGNRYNSHKIESAGRNAGIGYALEAMKEANLGNENDLIPCEWDIQGAFKAAAVIGTGDDQHDAFFCMNDVLGIGLMRSLHDLGIEVPRDKAVFGFDGIEMGSFSIPTLSTVALDFAGMAEAAVSMLINRIDGISQGPVRQDIAGFRIHQGESA